ncbi:hypothetical protein N9X87_00430 [bacterium]|nr:hypothetical protein [bacterium]
MKNAITPSGLKTEKQQIREQLNKRRVRRNVRKYLGKRKARIFRQLCNKLRDDFPDEKISQIKARAQAFMTENWR